MLFVVSLFSARCVNIVVCCFFCVRRLLFFVVALCYVACVPRSLLVVCFLVFVVWCPALFVVVGVCCFLFGGWCVLHVCRSLCVVGCVFVVVSC